MRSAHRFAVFVAVVVAIAAVAEPAGAAAKTDRPESCRLLRAAEITEALAQPTAGATPSHVPLLCDWTLAATDTRPAGEVSVYLRRGDSAIQDFNLARDFHGDSRIKLGGLGRKAFYAPALETVYVLEDPATVFFVQGLYPTGATVDATGLQTALVALAGKAAQRV